MDDDFEVKYWEAQIKADLELYRLQVEFYRQQILQYLHPPPQPPQQPQS